MNADERQRIRAQEVLESLEYFNKVKIGAEKAISDATEEIKKKTEVLRELKKRYERLCSVREDGITDVVAYKLYGRMHEHYGSRESQENLEQKVYVLREHFNELTDRFYKEFRKLEINYSRRIEQNKKDRSRYKKELEKIRFEMFLREVGIWAYVVIKPSHIWTAFIDWLLHRKETTYLVKGESHGRRNRTSKDHR